MSARNVLESQQSAVPTEVGRTAPGCWQLAAGRALSLRPRDCSVLEIAQGRVWLTHNGVSATDPPGAVADHVLCAGDGLTIAAGAHVVIEPWTLPGAPEALAVAFRWGIAPDATPVDLQPQRLRSNARRWGGHRAGVRGRSTRADWEAGVVLPLRDLVHALVQGGRVVGMAAGQVLGAAGRLAIGFGRFVWLRMAPPGPGRAA